MSVFIDGATISSLFYSHSGSNGNQEGFLFGRIINHVKDHISDSQINNSEVQTYLYVSSHLPWPGEDRVYSRDGVPVVEKLGSTLGEHKGEVIGWYSFRRNSSLRMSMKEKTVHRHLADRFCPQSPDDFLFSLCVSSASSEFSTHSMDHCFTTIKCSSGAMKKLPVLVTNLGDTSHTEYKTHGSMSSMQTGSVRAIVKEFQPEFESPHSEDMQEVKRIDSMSGVLNKSLMKLCSQVVESEKKTGALEEEVAALREKLRQKEEEQERQKQMLLNPAEHELAVSTSSNEQQAVASLYPKLPNKDDLLALGKGESSGAELLTGTGQREQVVSNAGNKDSDLSAAAKQGPTVDDLLCVSEVSSSVNANACDSERLVSQPDELIDLDEGSSDGQNVNIKHSLDSMEPKEKLSGKIGAPGKTKQDTSGPQNTDTSTKSKSSAHKKPSDHFSFVENIVKSASEGPGASGKKTATVPTGQTIAYSSRTTRSQAKTETTSSKQAGRDKSKLPTSDSHAESTSNIAAASPVTVSSEGTGKSVSGGASSAPQGQTVLQQSGKGNADGSGAGNPPAGGEPTAAQAPAPDPSHTDQKGSASAATASTKEPRLGQKKLDPSTFNLAQQQNKTQVATRSERTTAGTMDHGLHENGTDTKEEAKMQRSASPVF